MLDKNLITGLILAGGRGSRMSHTDKGLQEFKGAPMVLHVINRLGPQVGHLLISANRNLESYAQFGLPVFQDDLSGYEGPLAGFQSGLRHCQTPYLLTAPCDTPFLPDNLVERLAEALVLQAADVAVAVAAKPGSNERQPHPVFCLMKSTLLPHLNRFLESGGRKIDAWHSSLTTTEVLFDDPSCFRNINTLEELQQAEKTWPGIQTPHA